MPDSFGGISRVIELIPLTEESPQSAERLRTHGFRDKELPKPLVEVDEELPCEFRLARELYDEEASEGEGEKLSKWEQSSSNDDDDDDMPSKPEQSCSNEENDVEEDRDSSDGGALYEESTESRLIWLARSKEFMVAC